MEQNKLELLTQCAWCNAIKISGLWLRKEDNPRLYQRYIEVYKGKITHEQCPECITIVREKYNL